MPPPWACPPPPAGALSSLGFGAAPCRGSRGATQGRSRARLRLHPFGCSEAARARPPPPNLLLGAVLARARFAARELAPLRVFRSGSRGSLRGQVEVVVSSRRRAA